MVRTKYPRFIFYFEDGQYKLYKDFRSFATRIDLSGYTTKDGRLLAKAFHNDYRYFFRPNNIDNLKNVLEYFVTTQASLNKQVYNNRRRNA